MPFAIRVVNTGISFPRRDIHSNLFVVRKSWEGILADRLLKLELKITVSWLNKMSIFDQNFEYYYNFDFCKISIFQKIFESEILPKILESEILAKIVESEILPKISLNFNFGKN